MEMSTDIIHLRVFQVLLIWRFSGHKMLMMCSVYRWESVVTPPALLSVELFQI